MSCLPFAREFHAAEAVESRDHFAPALRRPRLLIRAAQAGQAHWRRERDLPRLMKRAEAPGSRIALRWLRAEEMRLNEARRTRAGDYILERHICVLIALLAELSQTAADRPVKVAAGATVLAFPIPRRAPVNGPGTTRPAHP